jgi:hypothetical protein
MHLDTLLIVAIGLALPYFVYAVGEKLLKHNSVLTDVSSKDHIIVTV